MLICLDSIMHAARRVEILFRNSETQSVFILLKHYDSLVNYDELIQ